MGVTSAEGKSPARYKHGYRSTLFAERSNILGYPSSYSGLASAVSHLTEDLSLRVTEHGKGARPDPLQFPDLVQLSRKLKLCLVLGFAVVSNRGLEELGWINTVL